MSNGTKTTKILSRIADHFVEWWLRRCPHDGRHVAADILDGDVKERNVPYCRRCGAVKSHDGREWIRPRPLWWPSGENMR